MVEIFNVKFKDDDKKNGEAKAAKEIKSSKLLSVTLD